MTEQKPQAVARFIGLIVGALWLVLTGFCSGAFLIGPLGEGNLRDVGVVLTIGISSAPIRPAIYAIGRRLRPR